MPGWGTSTCKGPGVRQSKECSGDREKGKVCSGQGQGKHTDVRGWRTGRGPFRWAHVTSIRALDMILEQGKDRVRAVFGGSLWPWHGAFSTCRAHSQAASNVGHDFCGCCKDPGSWLRGNVLRGGREDEEIAVYSCLSSFGSPPTPSACFQSCLLQVDRWALGRTVVFKRENVSLMPPSY